MLECVINVSEGRDKSAIATLSQACGTDLLDVHTDPHHNRSVFTLVGTQAPRRLANTAVQLLDIARHVGVHPRIGVVDVVPYVPLVGSTMSDAIVARDAFATWMATELGVPCFTYGSERTLPAIRRDAFVAIAPDFGPSAPHPTAGACAVGARDVLIAYNVWVDAPDLQTVRAVAAAVRSSDVRTLGLLVGDRFQVSCNLVAPGVIGPPTVVERVVEHGGPLGVRVTGCELVGLLPQSILDGVSSSDRERLDLGGNRTIESRLLRRARLT